MNVSSNRLYAKQYQYTYNNTHLTDEQRDFYEVNGYIVFRNLVDHALLEECKQRFLDICSGIVERGMTTVVKDISLKNKNVKSEYLTNKIQDLSFDDVFFKYISYKPVVDVVESIIGPNITAYHSMLINKPPECEPDDSRHPLHQDLHYFTFRPADSITASWTAMERVDEDNGCLFVIPGSHKWKLFKHDYPPYVKNKGYHGVFGFDEIPKVNLVMEKGDTVFFHPLTLHGSGPNLTKGFRKSISCHYADTNCHYIDATGTTQEKISKEIQEIAMKRGVPALTVEEIWKFKRRLVRGPPGNLQKMESRL